MVSACRSSGSRTLATAITLTMSALIRSIRGLEGHGWAVLRRNDIAIVRSNGNKDLVGRSMIFAGPEDRVAYAGFCIRARVNPEVADPAFIHYWLRSPLTRERLAREGSGTGIQNVSQGLLGAQQIALSPCLNSRPSPRPSARWPTRSS